MLSFNALLGLISELIALLAGLVCYRLLNKPFKLLLLYVAITCTVELLGLFTTRAGINIFWTYNLYLVADNLLQLKIIKGLVPNNFVRKTSNGFAALFMIVWALNTVWAKGVNGYLKFAFIADFLFLLIGFIILLYFYAMQERGPLYRGAVFWLCVGSILFYGCSFVYFSVRDYLPVYLDRDQNRILLVCLNYITAIRYLFIGYAFFLFRNSDKKQHWSNAG
ncbi:hypothetical protein [Niabella hirudinis]|uniref:hypothetical protein n=1 Tax=Niabella hirudinis TaxID=1285929 RepID=UPI003EC0459D